MSRGRRRDIAFVDSDYEVDMAAERRRGGSPSPSPEAQARVAKKPRAGRTTSEGTSEEDERRRRRLLANRRSAQRSRVKRLEEVGVLENLVDNLMKEVDELRAELGTWTGRQQELLSEQSKLAERLKEEAGGTDIDILCIAHIENDVEWEPSGENKQEQQQQQQQPQESSQQLSQSQSPAPPPQPPQPPQQQQQHQQSPPGVATPQQTQQPQPQPQQQSPRVQQQQQQQEVTSSSPPAPAPAPPPLPPAQQPSPLTDQQPENQSLQEQQPPPPLQQQRPLHLPPLLPPPPPPQQQQQQQRRDGCRPLAATAVMQQHQQQPEGSEEVAMECISPGRLLEICTTPLHETDHPNHLQGQDPIGARVAGQRLLLGPPLPGRGVSVRESHMECRQSGTGDVENNCGRVSSGGGSGGAVAAGVTAAVTASLASRTLCEPYSGNTKLEHLTDVEAGSGTSADSPMVGRPLAGETPLVPTTAGLYGDSASLLPRDNPLPYQADVSYGSFRRDHLPAPPLQQQQQQQLLLLPPVLTQQQQQQRGVLPRDTRGQSISAPPPVAISNCMQPHRIDHLSCRSGGGGSGGGSRSGGGACRMVPYDPTAATAVAVASPARVASAAVGPAGGMISLGDESREAGLSMSQPLQPTCSGFNPPLQHRMGEGAGAASTVCRGWDTLDATSPLSYGSKEPPLPPAAVQPISGAMSPVLKYGRTGAVKRRSSGSGGGGGAIPLPLQGPLGPLLEPHVQFSHPHTAVLASTAASRSRAVGVQPPNVPLVSTVAETTGGGGNGGGAAAVLPCSLPQLPPTMRHSRLAPGAAALSAGGSAIVLPHVPPGASGVSGHHLHMTYMNPVLDGGPMLAPTRRPGDALSAGGAAAGSLAAAPAPAPPAPAILGHAMAVPGGVPTEGQTLAPGVHPTGSADSTSSNSSHRRRSASSDSERSLALPQREAAMRPLKQEIVTGGPLLHPHGALPPYPDMAGHAPVMRYAGTEGRGVLLEDWDLL
ncbi:hypothetical protein Vretimale_3496 [Volvox reticuliferus]|uniref:BZIP domain-containing protein n=1 Tax=Volvox reticuliferus TaxID=1737510 RepID=A0A8J4DF72_9CHLO|nr:hypothetical protein Vretimale_3496 [Volvox reticuliferus]